MGDLISRQAAIDALEQAKEQYFDRRVIIGKMQDVVNNLPSAQPDERMLHESCTDCPLYDKDRHSCPRFNKVIPVTLRELQSAQPEIIQCRNCKFASGDSRICMKFGHSPIGELDFCAWAERRTDEE